MHFYSQTGRINNCGVVAAMNLLQLHNKPVYLKDEARISKALKWNNIWGVRPEKLVRFLKRRGIRACKLEYGKRFALRLNAIKHKLSISATIRYLRKVGPIAVAYHTKCIRKIKGVYKNRWDEQGHWVVFFSGAGKGLIGLNIHRKLHYVSRQEFRRLLKRTWHYPVIIYTKRK